MGLMRDLLFGGLAGVGEAAATVGRVFVGDRAAGEAQRHGETMALMGQYAAEFRRIEGRTWFDSLVDGLNRLVRPGMAIGTMYLFAYAMQDPVGFAARMQALDTVPAELWYLLGAIVGFFFGARELQKHRDSRTTQQRLATVQAVVEGQSVIRALAPPPVSATTPGSARLSDEAFRRKLADTSQPLSNAAILEWNRRQEG